MPHYKTGMIWRLDKSAAGSGAIGDLGSHIVDLGHFLVGDYKSVSAMTRTFITERPYDDGSGMGKVEVDDAFAAAIEFANGAIGTLECTRFGAGRKNYQVLEINGELGSIHFGIIKSPGRRKPGLSSGGGVFVITSGHEHKGQQSH